MVVLAAKVWHFWIAVALRVRRCILAVVATVVLVPAQGGRCPGTRRRLSRARRRRLGHGASGWRCASAGREPFAESYHYDSLRARLRPSSPRRPRRLVADETGLRVAGRAGPGPGHRPRRLGRGPTSPRSSGCCGPLIDKLERPAVEADALSPVAQKLAGAEVGHAARLDVDPGARPVRPADHRGRGPRRTRTSSTTWAPTCWPSRSASPSRPASSGCGWPCTRSPTGPSSPASPGCGRTSSASSTRRSTRSTPIPSGSSSAAGRLAEALRQRRRTRSPTAASWRLLASPEQRAGARPGQRADEPARGPRRRHHGPGRREAWSPAPSASPGCCASGASRRQRPGPPAPAAHRPRGQAEPVRPGRAVHRGGRGGRRPAAARPRPGRARSTCRRSTRSGTRRRGSAGSRRPWPADRPRPAAGVGPAPWSTRRRRAARPAAPSRPAGTDGGVRRVGRRRLAGPAGAGRAPPAAMSPRCTSTTACAPARRPRPSVVAARPRPLGAAFRAEQVDGRARPEPRGPGPRRPLRRAAAPTPSPGHTADDQAETMLLNLLRGRRARRAGRHPRRPAPPAARPAPGRDRGPVRRARPRRRCDDPSNDDPPFRRNRVRHEVLPLLDDVAEPRRGRRARPPGRASCATTADLLDELAAALDPTDAARPGRRRPAAWPRVAVRRWLAPADADGHPPDAGHGRAGAGRGPARGPWPPTSAGAGGSSRSRPDVCAAWCRPTAGRAGRGLTGRRRHGPAAVRASLAADPAPRAG